MDKSTQHRQHIGNRRSDSPADLFFRTRGILSRPCQPGRVAVAIFFCFACIWSGAAEPIRFEESDVVACIGGADVAVAQHSGHLESLLAAEMPKVRFRNFGWEGDTVFAQPRDFNFPPLIAHLRSAKATVVIVQFGRTEALTANTSAGFNDAYRKLLQELVPAARKLILVTPVPFEKPAEPLPDLSARNPDLQKIAEIIREVGREKKVPVIDLFAALKTNTQPFTEDGLQFTPLGHAIVAQAFAAEMGLNSAPKNARDVTPNAAWTSPKYEALRQAIIAKNQLWFHYWRPQNWAFLGGDRVEQPSSRDHRDPKVRWFPAEIEKFQALIAKKEMEIAQLAEKLNEK